MSEWIQQKFTKPRRKKDHPDYKPHPFRRPGPGGDETRKTEIAIDISLKVFNFASKTLPYDQKMNWSDIQGIAISDSGDSGTVFVESEHGSIVVKGSPNIAIGTFFYNLAEVLMIPVPQRRIVRYDEPEFKQITKELQRATFIHDDLHQRVRSRLDRPFLEVLEYIPGITLSEMGPQRATKILNSYDPKSRNRMIRLGMVYALDILINNSERLPLSLWNNVGDIDHLIVRTDPSFIDTTRELRDTENLKFEYEMIYALDQRHTFFDELDPYVKQYQLSKYYVAVEEFLNQLFVEMVSVMQAQLDPLYETKEQKLETLMALKKLVYTHTLYEMKEMTILQVMIGMILAIDNISFMGIQNIEMIYESLFIEKDYKDSWNNNLKRINLDYFASIVSIFKKFLHLHKNVVGWAKDITLNQYAFDPSLLEEILMRSPRYRKQKEEERLRLQMEQEELPQEEHLGESVLMNQSEMNQSANDQKIKSEFDKGEILEEDLDEDELNKRIKVMFDVDLDDLALRMKQGKAQGLETWHDEKDPILQKSDKQNDKSMSLLQLNNSQVEQQQQYPPFPQLAKHPNLGGMLVGKDQQYKNKQKNDQR